MDFEMGRENKYGKILHYMKDIGKMIKLTEEEDSFMQQEMFMRVNGRMIRPMVMEYIQELMDQLILVTGLRISSMDMVFRSGRITLPMKENIFKGLNMELANLYGLMEQSMKAILKKI
jgi:hypothetical protein